MDPMQSSRRYSKSQSLAIRSKQAIGIRMLIIFSIQSIPSAKPRAPIPIPAAAVIAGAAFCVTWLTTAVVGTTVPVPDLVTVTLPVGVVPAEAADEAAATTELALAELKVLWIVKLQRVKTSRTSLSLMPSSSSVSVSYCRTQASQAGIKVLALDALQMH